MGGRQMNELTERQSDVFEYIKQFIVDNHYPPSVREICQGVGLKSSSTVHSHLVLLKEKGYISWKKDNTRTIVVL